MPKSIDQLVSFSSGEVSPKLDARVDQAKYRSALRQCLNMIPYKTGGLTRRPGTQEIGQAYLTNSTGHNYAVRLMNFIFSPTTTFVLEFGHNYIRFYSNGQQVTLSSAPVWTSGGSYSIGSFVEDPGDSNNIYYCIANLPPNTQPHNATAYWNKQTAYQVPTPYGADAGTGSIYTTDVFVVAPCQINDVIYLVHPDYPPYSLTRYADTNWVMEQVNFNTPALLDQNATDTQITASATTGLGITLSATAPSWVMSNYYAIGNSVTQSSIIYNCLVAHVSGTFATDLANGYWVQSTIFQTGHIFSTWQLAYLRPSAYIEYDGTAASGFSDGTSSTIQCLGQWEVHTYGVWSSDIAIQRSLDGGQTWDTVRTVTGRSDRNVDITGTASQLGIYRIVVSNSAALVNAGATNPRVVFECVDSFLYGLVEIIGVTNAYTATANVITELANTSATEYWSEAAWSTYRGFPQAVASYQQRMIYGGSAYQPQRIWGTVTNDIENFALGDQTLATDSFAFDINAPGRGPIQTLIAQTDLFVFFSGAEWVVNSGTNPATGGSTGAAITPTNVNAVEHTSFGSAPYVQPVNVANYVFFCQRQATSIRQMEFSITTGKYMSQDLTALSEHLFTSGIVQLAYQNRWRKGSLVWAVTQQGTLAGFTYDAEQEVFGWHRHQTGYGQVDVNGAAITPDNGWESITVIPGQGSNDDEVWLVANRLIGGVNTRFIERINPLNWEEVFTGAPYPASAVLADAFYVDCGKTITSPGSLTITGLSYLNGRYVYGIADGAAFGPLLVSAGACTLPSYIPTTVQTVQVGLPISYAAQPMRLDADPRAGNTQALVKTLTDLYLRVYNSIGGSISNGTTGTNAQQPVPIPYTPTSGAFATPVLVTTPTDIRIQPMQMPVPGADPVIVIQGNDALPITILALILKYDITGTP